MKTLRLILNDKLRHGSLAFFAISLAALTSCSVSPNGPAGNGASNGSLGSQNMSDYYYQKAAGWVYAYSNVENLYDSTGSVSSTLTGSNDSVFTMGYDGTAPNGDSLFRYQIHYRVLTSYSGNPLMNINYLSSTKSDKTHGAFVIPGDTVSGMETSQTNSRAVSCDTIVAGIGGYIRTTTDDFSNSGNYTWQIDTLWCTSHLDSVFIWEKYYPGGPLVKERCVFIRNFQTGNSWTYDLTTTPTTTSIVVSDANCQLTTSAGSFSHCAKLRVYTPEIDDKDFNRENKWFACGTGLVYQYDWWYVTADGNNFNKQDFTRSLISLSHN